MKRYTILALLLAVTLSITLSPTSNIIQQPLSDKSPSVSAIPAKIFAGQIHYSRIPVEYWEHRIQMVKALGLNALSVYVMWNYHQVSKGVFDYTTQNKNLSRFLELAEKYQMKVLFRPGPYVCAEWDFGGLPARLLNVKNLVIRANNGPFLQEVKIYFQSLVPIINKHMNTPSNPKGSIILLQIENQYGFYGTDKSYIEALRKIWFDFKVECAQYYVDWVENIQKCHWNGANIGINNGISQVQFDYVRTFEKKGYLLGGQIYSGWLTHWGEKWQSKSIQKNQEEYGFLMYNNHSYSMYMVHGGTNFGLTAGANSISGQKYDFGGHVTSYDYDAPINQQGSSTPKYQSLKTLIKKHATWTIPAQPSPIKQIQIPRFKLSPTASLLSSVDQPTVSNSKQYYMFQSDKLQMYNQGFVIYQTNLTKRKYYFQGVLHDYAMVFVDGLFVTSLDRSEMTTSSFVVQCAKDSCVLRILVEAMGHINFDHQMEHDYKGILDITDDLATNFTWDMYTIPVDSKIMQWNKYNPISSAAPTVLKSTFNLQQTGDVYLETTQLTKGYLWVNGRNLGRYWSKGPQQRLFCPGVWLKTGQNTVYVLDLHFDGKQKGITGKKTLQWEPEKYATDSIVEQ